MGNSNTMINTELANVDYLLLMTKHDIQDLDYQIEIKNDYFYNINYFENNYLRKSTRIFSEHNHLFKPLSRKDIINLKSKQFRSYTHPHGT